jgi:ABC-type dipeptide/oligopeptide/nickel transport system permease component
MKMWVYIMRRILLLVPVVIGVMTITFALISFLPIQDKLISYIGPSKLGYSSTVACTAINPAAQAGTTCANPAYVNGVRTLGLDKPIVYQWALYIYNSLTLNWGQTEAHSLAAETFGLTSSQPVATVLGWFVPYTLELAALSLTIILLLAIPLGNYSAVYRNRPLDQGARILSFSGFALPGFLLATLLLVGATFASGGFAPLCNSTSFPLEQWYNSWPKASCLTSGAYPSWIGPYLQTAPTGFPTVDAVYHQDWQLAFESVKRLILPAIAIAYGAVAVILRFVRNSMLEVMNLDFVRTARAKGVSESTVVRRHAGRNSLNVTVTVLGLTFAGFIGGFPIIEQVFNLRGIGLILALSIQQPYDFGLIFGATLLFTIIVVIANIIVDVLYAYLDPRVRLG